MSIGGPYWSVAIHTLHADWWTILTARIFGKKFVGHDNGNTITMYRYRGKSYMTGFEEKVDE